HLVRSPSLPLHDPSPCYRSRCLLMSRWKVLRSMSAALAAADTLPPWRASRSRRYAASSTAIQRSLASFNGASAPRLVSASALAAVGAPPPAAAWVGDASST